MVVVSFPIRIPEDNPFGPHNIPFGIFSTPTNVGLGVSIVHLVHPVETLLINVAIFSPDHEPERR